MRLSMALKSEFFSPDGETPASNLNFSAASLNPSANKICKFDHYVFFVSFKRDVAPSFIKSPLNHLPVIR